MSRYSRKDRNVSGRISGHSGFVRVFDRIIPLCDHFMLLANLAMLINQMYQQELPWIYGSGYLYETKSSHMLYFPLCLIKRVCDNKGYKESSALRSFHRLVTRYMLKTASFQAFPIFRISLTHPCRCRVTQFSWVESIIYMILTKLSYSIVSLLLSFCKKSIPYTQSFFCLYVIQNMSVWHSCVVICVYHNLLHRPGCHPLFKTSGCEKVPEM